MTDEQLAQTWHDEQCSTDKPVVSLYWACCVLCDPDWGGINPYFGIAQQDMRDSGLEPMRRLTRAEVARIFDVPERLLR